MTTSSSSSPPPPAPPSRPTSEDSAKAVGFELVKHYYTNLMANPDTIYGMYGKSASLQHHNPFQGDFARNDIAYSRDEIREHYKTNSVFKDCKILVQNLDAQPSINESVMILCNGEIAFNKSEKIGPCYKFVQSFYITPKKSDNVTYYDIINDILRFIPDVDDEFIYGGEEKSEEEEEKEKEEAEVVNGKIEEPKEKEAEKTSEEFPIEQVKPEAPKNVETTDEQEVEQEAEQEAEKEAKKEEEEEEEPKQQEIAKPVKANEPAKPISWAARVATSTTPVSKSAKIVSPLTTSSKETAPISQEKVKNTKRRSSSGKKTGKKEDSPPIGGINGKNFKRKFLNKRNEEVYPIYIKGLNSEIDKEEQLVSLLEREFGKTDSCKLNNLVALVDFVKQSAQEKAIQLGTIRLNDHDLKLEPRIEKRKDRK